VVAVAHVSNVLGTINPVGDIVGLAKKVGAYTVIDGAQWPSAGLVDVRSLGCDFYAFSAHKVFGPMGVGILYGRQEVLNKISPFRFGGGMVQKVTAREVVYRDLPERLEGGTPNVAGAVALPCMFEFLGSIDWPGYRAHEQRIRSAIEDGMHKIPGLRLLGTAADKVGIYAFSHPNIHAHDLASLLASQHICVRAGNHCAQLLLPHFNISQSLRASFSIYNTVEEAGQFMTALGDAIRFLR
jgi:cysteine desulfurase/selenocysteine lyase